MITLKQLKYALAVEQTLHFKKAAELVAVSQSALSTAINELEGQIGFLLFERNNKNVFITSQGRDFLARALQIVTEVDDLMVFSHQMSAPMSYPMTLGVIPTIGPFLLPKVLPGVRQSYPQLKLHIIEAQSQVLLEKVRRGELDTAILALPYPVENLHVFEFWSEDFYVVMHRDFAGQRIKGIRATSLQSEELLLLQEGHCLKDHALAACRLQVSGRGDHTFSGTSLYTLVQMVAGRSGMTLVPELGVRQLVGDSQELRALHLDEPGPHRTLAFITRLNYPGVDSVQSLIDCFKKTLAQTY